MNQNDVIRKMVDEGKKIIVADFEAASDVKRQRERVCFDSWKMCFDKIKENTPLSIVDSLFLQGVDIEDSIAPPLCHLQRGKVTFNIDGLAPLTIVFNSDCRIDRYIVPEISSFSLNGDKYGWEYYKQDRVHGLGETEVVETKDLPYAMALAEQRFKIMQKLNEEWQQKVAEEELKEKEPVYVNEDGSEPLPDLVVINGLRAIIREEIHKLAMAD